MVLRPLEFAECLTDSPWFRQNLHDHENALDRAYKMMKQIEHGCRDLILAAQKLSQTQRNFSKLLRDFSLDSAGASQTDEERVIAQSLREFGRLIAQVEDQRDGILDDADKLYIEPLRRFRTEKIGKTLQEDRKRFEKASGKYNQSLEKHLHLSTARKNDFSEADAALGMEQRFFCRASLDYVFVLQSVQERMKFEFVEILSAFLYSWLSFYHVGHVIHQDFKPYLDSVQIKVQKAKESFLAAQMEAQELKDKMLNNQPADSSSTMTNIKQGYLYCLEKKNLVTTWTKYYCVFQKESRIFTMIPFTQTAKRDMNETFSQSVSMKLHNCTRRASDSIDKRFCFDIATDRSPEVLTLQALSDDDRKVWLDALDGSEPVYSPTGAAPAKSFQTQLDSSGCEFIQSCVTAIEDRGIAEQGLYRNCGVNSKVQKLMQLGLDRRKTDRLNLYDDREWEIRTITSAVKSFLRNLAEPLMTFDLHGNFINAAKLDSRVDRVAHVHYYVHQLPSDRFRMLELIVRHLRKVADRADQNLMTVGNLGVCFGPTLLRPREESMAAIMDIKFCNVVVELLLEHCEKILGSKPTHAVGLPCPPKPAHCLDVLTTEIGVRDVPPPPPPPPRPLPPRPARPTAPTSGRAPLPPPPPPPDGNGKAAESGNSCDSLNSLGSAATNSESSPSPNRSHGSTASKSRMSVSYAPPYPGDIPQKRLSGPQLLSNSYAHLQDAPPFVVYLNMQSQPQPSRRVRTLYECSAGHETELTFMPGQIVTNVYQSKEPGWLVGTLNGKTGLLPANYVEPLP